MHEEKVFYLEGDFLTLRIPKSGKVGVLMSGGADSSLLAYLLARTIKTNHLNVEVYPVTAELLARPYNLRHSTQVINWIEKALDFEFSLHLSFIVPNHQNKLSDQEKVAIKSDYTRDFMERFNLDFYYSGLTSNPPVEDLPSGEFSHRHDERDDESWKKEQESKSGLMCPFIWTDKRGIANLYRKLNLFGEMLPLTRSCEAEREETDFCTKDCFDVRAPGDECYWCRERKYGFSFSKEGEREAP